MAGDWLPVQKDLFEAIEVLQIAAQVKKCRFQVLGKLVKVWAWFDTHTADGVARGIDASFLDDMVEQKGFAAAMQAAGWLDIFRNGIRVPNFEHWMGQSGKRRQQHNRNVAAKRAQQKRTKSAQAGAPVGAPEKRREQNKKINNNGRLPVTFADEL